MVLCHPRANRIAGDGVDGPVRQRRAAIEQLATIPERAGRLVLAIGKYIGEGFDDARLDTLFLTMPVSWKGTVVQYAGRLHRAHRSKIEVQIYDCVDEHVPMLAQMHSRRVRGYRLSGYTFDPQERSQRSARWSREGVWYDAELLRRVLAAAGE